MKQKNVENEKEKLGRMVREHRSFVINLKSEYDNKLATKDLKITTIDLKHQKETNVLILKNDELKLKVESKDALLKTLNSELMKKNDVSKDLDKVKITQLKSSVEINTQREKMSMR